MSAAPAAALPKRRPSLVMRQLADVNQFVVKNGPDGLYDLDEHAYFLLERLDGSASPEEVRAAFEAKYKTPLSPEELAEFINSLRDLDFLHDGASAPAAEILAAPAPPPRGAAPPKQNLLFF